MNLPLFPLNMDCWNIAPIIRRIDMVHHNPTRILPQTTLRISKRHTQLIPQQNLLSTSIYTLSSTQKTSTKIHHTKIHDRQREEPAALVPRTAKSTPKNLELKYVNPVFRVRNLTANREIEERDVCGPFSCTHLILYKKRAI